MAIPPLVGATLAGAGMTAGTGLINSLVSSAVNLGLQKDQQHYNTAEANKNRDWQSEEARLAREWQTNANQAAMDFNATQAQINRDWQAEMSNTAHQREMADLKAAGINPILAANNGADTTSGATGTGVASNPIGSPSGSTAHSSANSVGKMFDNITNFVGDYLASAQKISLQADRFQHDFAMQEMKQKHAFELQKIRQEQNEKSFNIRFYKRSNKSYDSDDFFESALKRSMEVMNNV